MMERKDEHRQVGIVFALADESINVYALTKSVGSAREPCGD